jgi:hypothetical protein
VFGLFKLEAEGALTVVGVLFGLVVLGWFAVVKPAIGG